LTVVRDGGVMSINEMKRASEIGDERKLDYYLYKQSRSR
jgi:hypothetical protein